MDMWKVLSFAIGIFYSCSYSGKRLSCASAVHKTSMHKTIQLLAMLKRCPLHSLDA
jgi:hypothetical protein